MVVRKLYLGLAGLALLSAKLIAATYYVAPTGSDTNSGTLAAPFYTIAKPVGLVTAGDTMNWSAILTNAPLTGILLVTATAATNRQLRFYRAEEL